MAAPLPQPNQQEGGPAQEDEGGPLSPIHSLHIKPPISSPPPPILSPEGMDCFGNERSVSCIVPWLKNCFWRIAILNTVDHNYSSLLVILLKINSEFLFQIKLYKTLTRKVFFRHCLNKPSFMTTLYWVTLPWGSETIGFTRTSSSLCELARFLSACSALTGTTLVCM